MKIKKLLINKRKKFSKHLNRQLVTTKKNEF